METPQGKKMAIEFLLLVFLITNILKLFKRWRKFGYFDCHLIYSDAEMQSFFTVLG